MEFSVLILGSNSALPAHGRHPSSQLINIHDQFYLMDCGEGTQMQLDQYDARKSKIDSIFISHLHGDHYFGIFGLLTTYNLMHRNQPLTIYGPEGIRKMIETVIDGTGNALKYKLEIVELQESDKPQMIHEDREANVMAFALRHRIPTFGFLFEEKRPLRRLDGQLLDQHDVPIEVRESIRDGRDYIDPDGRRFPASYFFLEEIKPARYAYCSDTMVFDELSDYVEGVDLLYHEATFLCSEKDRAEKTMHSTAGQAAMTAKRAGAKKLLIGHFSSRYKSLCEFQKEASAIFPTTELAEEGKTFHIE